MRGHVAAGIRPFTVSSALARLPQPQALQCPTWGAGSGSSSEHDRQAAIRASYCSSGTLATRALASALSHDTACDKTPDREAPAVVSG